MIRKFILFLGILISFTACDNTDMTALDVDRAPTKRGPVAGAADSFDLDLALELARLDLQAYQMLVDFNAGKTFQLPAPYTLVKQFFTNEVFEGEAAADSEVPIAYIATKGSNVYVVFRGTVTIVEWIDDAEFGQVSYRFTGAGGLTEEGFTDVYASIHQQILDTLHDLAASGSFDTLYVTGHSLGAALAVLAAPELGEKGPFGKPVMVNFAGPRVGNPTFAVGTYPPRVAASVRVVNTNDLVPKLPEPVVTVFKNNQFHTFYYDHVDTEHAITFGHPITGPTDTTDIEANHILCNYYNALCEMTQDVAACKKAADGADGCNA